MFQGLSGPQHGGSPVKFQLRSWVLWVVGPADRSLLGCVVQGTRPERGRCWHDSLRDNFQQGLRPTGPAVFSARHSTPYTWFVALLPTPCGSQGWLSR